MEEGKLEVTNTNTPKIAASRNYTVIGLVIGLLALAGATSFLGYQYNNANNDNKKLQTQINELNFSLIDAKKQANASVKVTPSPTPTKAIAIPTSLKENIAAAINTMNTAALEGYMAPSVNVVLAASEAAGPRTPAEAVSDLAYLNSATAPWDFALPVATLNAYAAGDYANYFGENTVVGKSANKYVVSFRINSSSKIDQIFMSVSSDLL